MEKLLTVDELSALLNISPKTIYAHVYFKDIPYTKIFGALRFKLSDIQKWIETRTHIPIPIMNNSDTLVKREKFSPRANNKVNSFEKEKVKNMVEKIKAEVLTGE